MTLFFPSADATNSVRHSDAFKLRQVYLLLTRKCNLSCTHCIRSSTPFHQEMMDTQLALDTIQQLSQVSSEATLMISGGEPTLHPDFEKIVSAGSKRFTRVVVNSNGLRLAPLVDAGSHYCTEIQISIDGDHNTHDRIRGKGTFQKTIANINNLARKGIIVTVATTVTNSNITSISILDSYLSDMHFSRWNVKRVVGSGRASDSDDISTEDWNKLVKQLSQTTKNRDRLRISSMFSEEQIKIASRIEMAEMQSLEVYNANCGTGRSKLYINPNGSVYPCACMENRIVGSFRSQPASEILKCLSLVEVEPALQSVCRICPAWAICRGGCPGAAQRTVAPELGDPRCPLAAAGRRDAGISNDS